MSVTVTDLFCGAGGSSLGAEGAGLELVMAANHWQTAIDVHQAHFPNAGHDCADISQADPRRYPATDVLLASPECTNHSQARGVSRSRQDPTLWDAPDPSAERSRATMWDVPRFAEQLRYAAIVVENVVEATKWVMWPAWWQAMELLGYVGRVLSHNSQDHGVAQSRDRIYVVWVRDGLERHLDLEMERTARCARCDTATTVRQAWKNGRSVGRYRQQWEWRCVVCSTVCEPDKPPAASIIDWSLDCPRIGDRARPLVDKTRKRIAAGLERHGWLEPLGAVCAEGNHHELLMRNNKGGAEMTTPVTEPARTMTTAGHQSLLMPYYGQSIPHPVDRPIGTVTTRDRYALIDAEKVVDDCGFRMLEPHEVAAAMAFPDGYIPVDLPKKDRVKLAGNAVTPPVATWITGRVLQALEAS